MQHEEFLKKVGELVIKAGHQGYIPVKRAIGSGVVIVQDSKNEFDTYFDQSKWEFVQPQIWENENTKIDNEIGILPGNGKYPRVSSFNEAMMFAVDHLKSKDQICSFYPLLQPVN